MAAPPVIFDANQSNDDRKATSLADEVIWTWREVIRTKRLGLSVSSTVWRTSASPFAYVTDIGFSPLVAATVLSIIASTQLGSTMVWGVISERMDIRHSSSIMFLVQSAGLALVLVASQMMPVYLGFFLYGIGLGGGWVLQELIWAITFGRISLGMVRGLGILVTHAFGAVEAPFFGFVHDVTGSYRSSFLAFVVALIVAAYLSLAIRPSQKNSAPAS